jgi:hypothetical protein
MIFQKEGGGKYMGKNVHIPPFLCDYHHSRSVMPHRKILEDPFLLSFDEILTWEPYETLWYHSTLEVPKYFSPNFGKF